MFKALGSVKNSKLEITLAQRFSTFRTYINIFKNFDYFRKWNYINMQDLLIVKELNFKSSNNFKNSNLQKYFEPLLKLGMDIF